MQQCKSSNNDQEHKHLKGKECRKTCFEVKREQKVFSKNCKYLSEVVVFSPHEQRHLEKLHSRPDQHHDSQELAEVHDREPADISTSTNVHCSFTLVSSAQNTEGSPFEPEKRHWTLSTSHWGI